MKSLGTEVGIAALATLAACSTEQSIDSTHVGVVVDACKQENVNKSKKKGGGCPGTYVESVTALTDASRFARNGSLALSKHTDRYYLIQ